MSIRIRPTGQACGAFVEGVDLSRDLEPATVDAVRRHWLEHHVLVFPDQQMNNEDLERFTRYFGPFGHDPFFKPIPGHEHIAAIRRDAEETTSLFAESWHTDWSFQKNPPIGTCLMAITVPPVGGDTLYANQHLALDKMPAALRAKIEGRAAIHSARMGYSQKGLHANPETEKGRSMDIVISDDALAEEAHPLILQHPENGREAVFGTALAYIVGIEGMEQEEGMEVIKELYAWQTRDEFVYRHQWQEGMLVMWDNRSVLHRATGGHEGHARLLHRTTIGVSN